MTAHRISASVLVALLVLAGCKKRSTNDNDTEVKPDVIAVPSTPGVSVVTSIAGPTGKVAVAFDQMTKEIEQDKAPSFWVLSGESAPKRPKGLIVENATAGRTEIDAVFGRFWTAWESRPERIRQQLIRQRAELLTKQGVPSDKAKEQAEQGFPPLPPLRVTTPNPDLAKQFFNRIEADVTNGVKGDWSQNGGMRVSGSVQFSESLRLFCNGDLSARLRGRAEKLILFANGGLVADLADLQAPLVEAQPNGTLFLRLGPGTNVLKLDGNAIPATVLVRGNPGLKVEGANNTTPRCVVINY